LTAGSAPVRATAEAAVSEFRPASFDYAAAPVRTVTVPVYYAPVPVSEPRSTPVA